jgi:hypothetical protein
VSTHRIDLRLTAADSVIPSGDVFFGAMATLIKLTRIAGSIKSMIRQRDWKLVVVFKTTQVRSLLHNGAARLIRDWPEAIVDSWQIDPKTGGAISLHGVTAKAPVVNGIAKRIGSDILTSGIKNNKQP